MSAYLACEGVTKRFGRVVALDGVSLKVNQGGFTCLLGPSGCGKSTLLRVIAGLEVPDAGRVYLNGQDITEWPPAKRGFGIVFQSYALFPNLTALENVAYGLRGLSREERRRRAQAMLDLVQMPDVGSRYPSELSGGQQQRVALARALAIQPRLLLLDEPLSALDARVRADLREELRALQRQLAITTVMVTHDQEEALSMADEVVVIADGKIRQTDDPEALYRYPRDLFVAGFIGAMNILEGWTLNNGTVTFGPFRLAHAGSPTNVTSTTVVAAIRPEDVRLAEGEPTLNTLEARIVTMEFRGAFYRVRLWVGDDLSGFSLTAHLPASEIQGLDIRSRKPIRIQLPADRLMVFPMAASEGSLRSSLAAAV